MTTITYPTFPKVKSGPYCLRIGSTQDIEILKGCDLKILQGAVEGSIETLDSSGKLDVYVNESGYGVKNPNAFIAEMLRWAGFLFEGPYIWGHCVITGNMTESGGMSKATATAMAEYFRVVGQMILDDIPRPKTSDAVLKKRSKQMQDRFDFLARLVGEAPEAEDKSDSPPEKKAKLESKDE